MSRQETPISEAATVALLGNRSFHIESENSEEAAMRLA